MTDTNSGKSSGPAEINFDLKVRAVLDGKKVSKISFNIDLNPDNRILEIGQHLSSRAGLAAVFADLDRVLRIIEEKNAAYNEMISYRPLKSFDSKFEENIKPTFGKIASIDYRHESPGAANVMYSRRYNGDLQPPL